MRRKFLSIILALCTFLTSFQSGMVLKVHAAETTVAGSVKFTENPTKIYDNTAVEDPSVDVNGDGAVTYAYYKVSDTGVTARLEGTPSDAGTYQVVASLAGTEHYSAATASEKFTIIQRPVSLGLSVHVSGSDATLTAFVNNAVDAAGKVKFTIQAQGSEVKSSESAAVVAVENSMYAASTIEKNIGAGTYTVTAEYETGSLQNYSCAASATGNFNIAMQDRTILGESSFKVANGSAPFNLGASASKSEGALDQFSYELVSDEYAAYNLVPSVTVDSSGEVTIWNAGTAYIKITLTDSHNIYNTVTKYVRVTVSPAELTVTSYAEDSGIATKTDAEYGALGGITYGLDYAGFKGEDNGGTFTAGHGTLSAVSLPADSGAGEYAIGIRQTGGSTITVNDTSYENVFLSRNYHINKTYGRFTVKPKSLMVRADNKTVTWGEAQPAYTVTMDGLASADTPESVFSEQPKARLSSNKSYDQLEPGSYAITLTGGTQKGNAKGLGNYNITLSEGVLTVNKRILDLSGMSWSDGSFTYDGNEHGPALSGTLPQGVTVTKSGDRETNAGTYTASAAFALADDYNEADYELRGTSPLTKSWSIAKAVVSGTKNPERVLHYTDTGRQTLTAADFGITADGSFAAGGTVTDSGEVLEKNISYGENVQYALKSGLTFSNQTIEIPVTFTPAGGNYAQVDLTVKVKLVEKYSPVFTLAAVRNGNSLVCTATLKKDKSITEALNGEINFYLDTAGTGKPLGTGTVSGFAESADITLNLNELDPGVHTIYAVYSGNTAFATATASVPADRVSIGSISLNKSVLVLNPAGMTETLKVTASPSDATIQSVTWESDDPGIATVDGDGTVTAVSAGATRITATSDDNPDISASCKVIVADSSDIYLEQLKKDDAIRSGVNAVYASPSDASMSDAVVEFVDGDVFGDPPTASDATASQKFTPGKAQTLLRMIWDNITYTIWHVLYVEDAGTSRYIYVYHNRILTVTFDPNGGSADRKSERTDENGKLADIPSASRSGYAFDGWFTLPSGGEQLTADTQCGSDTIYYAHWTRNAADNPGTGGSGGSDAGTKTNGEAPNVPGTWVGTAVLNGTRWQFRKTDGTMAKDTWIKTDNHWYHFDANGYAQTGWVLDQGKWYHCDPLSCAMDTGLYHDSTDGYDYYLNADGSMATGWVTISGKQYYFNPTPAAATYTYDPVSQTWIWNGAVALPYGALLKNTITPDGHHVDETGARID